MKLELKNHIIHQKKEIKNILSQGRFLKTKNLIFYYLTNEEFHSEFSFLISIPKKKIKLAVERNYLKRILRECIWKQKDMFNKLNAKIKFIVVYNNSTKIKYIKLELEMLAFLGKLKQ